MIDGPDMSKELQEELTFTKEEKAELERVRKIPVSFDADCLKTTPKKVIRFPKSQFSRKTSEIYPA